MKFLYSDEPIIACSTGNLAHAAMAVLRISGFKYWSQFSSFFSLKSIEPRKVYYTKLTANGEFLDDICLTYFEGPKSYNGENILELSVHGNTLNVERIMNAFIASGLCRAAHPGEFTYRALKNKKLTLSQVEGLDLFLNANSGYALSQGLSLLTGNLHHLYQELYQLFLLHKSSLELSIDFAEDVGEEAARDQYLTTLKNFSQKFQTLVKKVSTMEQDLIQPEIVLAGLPNSGKSSFFNKLLSDERAIVSPTAGTTRDYLSEMLEIEGVRYKLFDTAGVREASDAIEAEGVRRTKSRLANAFYKILLINPLEMTADFEDLLEGEWDQIYFTHADVPGFAENRQMLIESFPQLGPMGALNLKGDSSWENDLRLKVHQKYLKLTREEPILLERHKQIILQTSALLENYVKSTSYETDSAILSTELNNLGHCLSELLGIVSPDQILNSIFTNFCIGK